MPLPQDIIASVVFTLAYFAPAVALAVYATDWDGLVDMSRGMAFEGTIKETRDAVRAAAVSTGFCLCINSQWPTHQSGLLPVVPPV